MSKEHLDEKYMEEVYCKKCRKVIVESKELIDFWKTQKTDLNSSINNSIVIKA